MGDIGPHRQRYDVMQIPAVGPDDADLWTAPVRMSVPAMTVPAPEPMPVPQPEPVPEPSPVPVPEPVPQPPAARAGHPIRRLAHTLLTR